ncbi:MAG TPA: imidazole glycerol phosphate synthase subunit HisH [Candidatus Limiplasma sp.]|nr:imidazole glycerol phosphate synthase subunit HisH [Candidatus Limiplasma sp.]
MIAIIDYGVGNLYSLTCSLKHIGMEGVVTRDAETLRQADKIILPGVGAFGDAADKLHGFGLDSLVKEQAALGKPLLGICLGMQLLFDKSFEYGEHEGLGLIHGHVESMAPYVGERKVPHMGWNSLDIQKPDDPLLKGIEQGAFVYFVHSFYAADCDEALVATAQYGIPLTAIVRNKNVAGTQFHPEKSGEIGLKILTNFAKGVQ